MKRNITFATVFGALILGMTSGAYSQTPEGAYWVIEGDWNDPTYTLIHYYNQKNELIMDERLEGKYLDITRRKNIRILNKKLRAVLVSNKKENEKEAGKKQLAITDKNLAGIIR